MKYKVTAYCAIETEIESSSEEEAIELIKTTADLTTAKIFFVDVQPFYDSISFTVVNQTAA